MKKLLQRFVAVFCVLTLCLTPASALTVEEALGLLEENYVDGLPAAAYEATTLDELFGALGDPYTFYMDAEQYDDFNSATEDGDTVVGLGVVAEFTAEGIRIASVLSGGGAEEAGLVPGDLIIAVGDVSCVPAGSQHRAMILGDAGTYVDITVRHEDGTTQSYHIERREVTAPNTTSSFSDGVGFINCDSFGTQTADYFYEAIDQYGDDARAWIVDLRDNPGGYSGPAVGAVGAFTGPGYMLIYRKNGVTTEYTLYRAEAMTDKPAIVLVNSRSASAAEFFSNDICSEGAGIVIGSRTYGKGTAQVLFNEENHPELFDGDSLKVTSYRFYCSGGVTTDKIGVLPTLYVNPAYASDVARLLTAEQPKRGDSLTLTLNGCTFFIDLAQAQTEEYLPAFHELLAALPPDLTVTLTSDGDSKKLTSAQLLERYGAQELDRRFTDVSENYYATEINTLGTYGILWGTGDDRFEPNGTLTRAQLCAMLAQALNRTSLIPSDYSDVPEDSWYSGYVAAMSAFGFVNGVGDGRFDPDGTLTQAQFITVMGRLARYLNCNADDYALALTDSDLSDASLANLPDWARVGAKVLTGYEGNMFFAPSDEIVPDGSVTRAQAAASLCRVLKTLGVLSY